MALRLPAASGVIDHPSNLAVESDKETSQKPEELFPGDLNLP